MAKRTCPAFLLILICVVASATEKDPNMESFVNADGQLRTCLFAETETDLRGGLFVLNESSRPDLARIGYRLRGQQLQLLIWPVLDQAPHSQAVAYTLLEPVESMKLRYLDSAGGWHEAWGSATDTKLPKAVELTLALASGEHLTRVLAIP